MEDELASKALLPFCQFSVIVADQQNLHLRSPKKGGEVNSHERFRARGHSRLTAVPPVHVSLGV